MPDSDDFDFDHWKNLAERDPSAYFTERNSMIESFIAAQPADMQPMLRELQARIDATRAVAGSPLAATRELSRMLEQHLRMLSERLQALRSETGALHAALQSGVKH
ncbi:MAG: DUF3135 domain-containing protein [Rhodocyclaceae bacterium]|nr:DUF3135 domain-containing protein [Rhodocyclaceae bacterium]